MASARRRLRDDDRAVDILPSEHIHDQIVRINSYRDCNICPTLARRRRAHIGRDVAIDAHAAEPMMFEYWMLCLIGSAFGLFLLSLVGDLMRWARARHQLAQRLGNG